LQVKSLALQSFPSLVCAVNCVPPPPRPNRTPTTPQTPTCRAPETSTHARIRIPLAAIRRPCTCVFDDLSCLSNPHPPTPHINLLFRRRPRAYLDHAPTGPTAHTAPRLLSRVQGSNFTIDVPGDATGFSGSNDGTNGNAAVVTSSNVAAYVGGWVGG
jgi:hypothetical protein